MKTLLTLFLIAVFSSFYIPEKEIVFLDKPKDVQLYFMLNGGNSIIYDYTLDGDSIYPLQIPDHVMASMRVK